MHADALPWRHKGSVGGWAAGSGEARAHAPAVEAGAWRLLAEVAAQAHGAPDWAFLQVRRACPLMGRSECDSLQGVPCRRRDRRSRAAGVQSRVSGGCGDAVTEV